MVQIDNLTEITNVLEEGGLILYPTDTIWGIGCDACNPEAVHRVFKLKKRDTSKKFVILVDSMEMLKRYVKNVHPRIDTLLLYHVRPVTVIYENVTGLPDILLSSDGTVAIRVVQDSFCRALINQFGRPLVATSANVSDEAFPKSFGEISSDIIEGVDYVAQHRQLEPSSGEPSVIIKLSEKGELIFLRN